MTINAPEDFPKAFQDAWMARDGHAIGALFEENADFVNVVGIWWEDRAAIGRAHDYALKSFFSDTRLAAGRIKVRHLGARHALVHARFRLTGQKRPDGEPAGDRSSILSFVLALGDDGWRAVSAQNTDIVSGAETLRAAGNGLTPEDYRP